MISKNFNLAIPFKKLPKNLETVTSNNMIKKIIRNLKKKHEKTCFLSLKGRKMDSLLIEIRVNFACTQFFSPPFLTSNHSNKVLWWVLEFFCLEIFRKRLEKCFHKVFQTFTCLKAGSLNRRFFKALKDLLSYNSMISW